MSARLLLLAAFTLLPLFAVADDEKPDFPISGKTDAKYVKLDELFTELMTKYKELPGVSVAVAKDGEIVYARGFGWADREAKQPMKPDSLSRISSMSKPFTAVAIMQLVEKGKLQLDARVVDVLALKPAGKQPDARWNKVTIRHLLEHRGGWDRAKSIDPMYYSPLIVNEMGGKHPASAGTTIRYMLRKPLDFDPGEKFVYTNFGYCLLGRVIEKIGVAGYEAHVKKHVLEPLGIKGMRQGKSLFTARATGEVRYYGSEKTKAIMGPQLGKQVEGAYGGFCLETMDANSGWLASPSDLVTFACAFVDPRKCKILKPETVTSLFERPTGEKGDVYYGKGWLVRPYSEKGIAGNFFWHDASLEGMSGIVMHRPDGVTYSVLFNTREKIVNTEPAAAIEVPMNVALNRTFAAK